MLVTLAGLPMAMAATVEVVVDVWPMLGFPPWPSPRDNWNFFLFVNDDAGNLNS